MAAEIRLRLAYNSESNQSMFMAFIVRDLQAARDAFNDFKGSQSGLLQSCVSLELHSRTHRSISFVASGFRIWTISHVSEAP